MNGAAERLLGRSTDLDTLRALEAIALLAVVVDVATTALMVGTAQAVEVGLVARHVYPVAGGWGLAAVLLAAVGGAFALLRRLSAPWWAGVGPVALLVGNATRNAWLAVQAPPETVLWSEWAALVVAVELAAVVVWWRPDPRPALDALRALRGRAQPDRARAGRRWGMSRARQALATVAAVMVVVSFAFAGVPLPGPLPQAKSPTGTASPSPFNNNSYRKNRSSSGWFAGTALRTPSAVQAARTTISQNSVNGHLQRRRPPRRGAATYFQWRYRQLF